LDACLEFGLFERPVEGGWAPCHPGEPGSQPDVVRLLRHCRWNRLAGRFEWSASTLAGASGFLAD
jgi:hypothetical protein